MRPANGRPSRSSDIACLTRSTVRCLAPIAQSYIRYMQSRSAAAGHKPGGREWRWRRGEASAGSGVPGERDAPPHPVRRLRRTDLGPDGLRLRADRLRHAAVDPLSRRGDCPRARLQHPLAGDLDSAPADLAAARNGLRDDPARPRRRADRDSPAARSRSALHQGRDRRLPDASTAAASRCCAPTTGWASASLERRRDRASSAACWAGSRACPGPCRRPGASCAAGSPAPSGRSTNPSPW